MSAEPVLRFEARRSTAIAEKDGTNVCLTPQGQRLVKRLASETPKEQERTMRQIAVRVRQAKREEVEQRKRIILDVLRKEGEQDEDGRFVLLEKICQVLDISVIETVLLLHEINSNQLDASDDETYVYCFFNHGSGQVYVEFWEPQGAR
jgi:hypothetical protein